MKKVAPHMLVGQLVAEDYRAADVLRRYGIDFCCGGKRTLEEACSQQGIDCEQLCSELERLGESGLSPAHNPNHWSADFLAEYIVQVHHRYLRENLPILLEYTEKIARVHGKRHPELRIVEKLVQQLSEELMSHLEKEEHVLFPYVISLCRSAEYQRPPFLTAKNPISVMELEHENAAEMLEALRQYTADFTLPEDSCTTYRIAFAKLRELDEDLRQHVHLENNILFPKALELERTRQLQSGA